MEERLTKDGLLARNREDCIYFRADTNRHYEHFCTHEYFNSSLDGAGDDSQQDYEVRRCMQSKERQSACMMFTRNKR